VERCLQKPKDLRFASAEELLEALEALLPGRLGRKLREGESPFPGLVAFQEEDADRFFGRFQDIAATRKKIRERPLLAIVGPSGVGKSSLVRAGLVPALKAEGENWQVQILRPGRNPLLVMANFLRSLVGQEEEGEDGLVERMYREPGCAALTLREYAHEQNCKLLIFVDQFEELYTLVRDPADRSAFVALLLAIADDANSPLRLIVSMRSDFLDRVGEDPLFLRELGQGLVFLQAPGRESLREALTQPVEMVGYDFESPGLVTEMLDSLETTKGALPLLQFAATELWEQRDRGRKKLTRASYEKIGGVAGVLASHANEVMAGLTASQRKLARLIFLRLVTPERTRSITEVTQLQHLSKSPAEVSELIDTLVQSRLLVVQNRDKAAGPAIEIVHESLIDNWPTLKLWLEEHEGDDAYLEVLRTAARQWAQQDRAGGLLWRGEASSAAKRFQERYTGELELREHEFLDAVSTVATRAQRNKRLAITGSFVLLGALIVAAAIALFFIRTAEKEAVSQAEVAERETRKAKDAAAQVLKQLNIIEEKEAARLKAEQEAGAAASEAAAAAQRATDAEEVAKSGQETIAMTRDELQAALDTAKKEKEHARSQQLAAEASQKKAESAKSNAERERARADKLFQESQREVERLNAEGKKINNRLD
jgi:energy-coupling factor transporter ATP-binding protein EcfA2